MTASSSQYAVFISHAGPDKKTVAIPLREKLLSHGIAAFVDEADMEPGIDAPEAMTDAMETVKVAVVVMSPEFVARKWPMKELMCFLRRREETQGQPRCVPVIIPFFYRLSVSELYDEPRLDRVDEDQNSIYRASHFLERMENREPEAIIAGIKAALRELQRIMGVRNDDGVSNDSGYEMQIRRDKLLQTLSEKIRGALRRMTTEITANVRIQQETIDTFQAYYDADHDTENLVFKFLSRDKQGNASTSEAKLLAAILGDPREKKRVIAVVGIGGVGKTSVLRALSCLTSVQETFKDGVYRVTLGAQCTRRELFDSLSTVVHNSGGREAARTLRQENEFRKAMECFRAWFDGRRWLLVLDDIWETEAVPASVIYELLKPHDSGKNCTIVLTTRSSDIASRAGTCIRLEPRIALGSESREILVQYSGITPTEYDEASNQVVAQILERCSGLPLFLAAAGKAMKALSFRRGHEGCAAYYAYARRNLEANMCSLLYTDVDDYERLAARLRTSIYVTEKRRSLFGFPVGLEMARIHRRLAVIIRQSRVPMTMLRWLWELKDDRQAVFVSRELEQVGLADVEFEKRGTDYVEMLRLHDSVYDFAVGETKREGEETLGHETVLRGYQRSLKWKDPCHEWWSTTLQPDGYIHENLCRHLAKAGRQRELIELLLCPEWAWRAVEISNVFGLEEDLTLGIRVLQNLQKDGIDIFSDSSLPPFGSAFESHSLSLQTLELVLEALKLSFNCLWSVASPQELFFQLHGRLVHNTHTVHPVATSSNVQAAPTESTASTKKIETYLKRMDGCWPTPRVQCVSSFLEAAGGALTRLVALNRFICCMDVINDGIHVVCGLNNGKIAVVNLLRSEVEYEWQAHDSNVDSIAVAGNQRYLLSGSRDGTAKVFDLQSHDCITTFKGHKGHSCSVTCVAVLDENRAVSGSDDGTAQVWSMQSGEILSPPFKRHAGLVKCLAVLPDAEHVVSGGDDNTLRIWNATTGAQVGPPFIGHSWAVSSVAVTVDGKRIVSGSWGDKTIRIWSTQSHRQICEPLTASESILCVRISPDGKRIISGNQSEPTTVRVWNAENGTQVGDPLIGHSWLVSGVLFLKEESLIASCSGDGTVRVWDLRRNTVTRLPKPHSGSVTTPRVSFTADGTRAVSDDYFDIRIWCPRSGRQLSNVQELLPDGSSSETSSDEETSQIAGDLISSFMNTPLARPYVSFEALYGQEIKVWNLESGNCLRTFLAGGIESISVTPRCWQAVTGSHNGDVEVWDLTAADGNPFVFATHPSKVQRVFLSDDGLRVISVHKDDNISLWDVETRRPLRNVASKEDAWKESRAWILHAIGEATSEGDAALRIPLRGREIIYCDGTNRRVLATMESEIHDWALSPDRSTICVGLKNGCVGFMTLEV